MFELLWGIMNAVILIAFIVLCFRSVQLIREKIGGLAALIFVFGLFSFVGGPDDDKNLAEKSIALDKPTVNKKPYTDNTYTEDVTLQRNLTSSLGLSVKYGVKNNTTEMRQANCSREGFISGTDWHVNDVIVNKISRNVCEYHISGIMKWKILGIPVYREPRQYDGQIKLERKN